MTPYASRIVAIVIMKLLLITNKPQSVMHTLFVTLSANCRNVAENWIENTFFEL